MLVVLLSSLMADSLSETKKQATITDFFQVIERWDLPINSNSRNNWTYKSPILLLNYR